MWRSRSQHLLQMFPLRLDCVFYSSDADLRPVGELGSTLSDTHGGPGATLDFLHLLRLPASGRDRLFQKEEGLDGQRIRPSWTVQVLHPHCPSMTWSWPGLCHIHSRRARAWGYCQMAQATLRPIHHSSEPSGPAVTS